MHNVNTANRSEINLLFKNNAVRSPLPFIKNRFSDYHTQAEIQNKKNFQVFSHLYSVLLIMASTLLFFALAFSLSALSAGSISP